MGCRVPLLCRSGDGDRMASRGFGQSHEAGLGPNLGPKHRDAGGDGRSIEGTKNGRTVGFFGTARYEEGAESRSRPVFETAPFDRSGTSPSRGVSDLAQRRWEQQENPRPEHWTDWQTGQRACSKDLSGDGFIDDHELDLCDPHHIVQPNPRLSVDQLGVCADYQPPAVAAPFVRHRQESG